MIYGNKMSYYYYAMYQVSTELVPEVTLPSLQVSDMQVSSNSVVIIYIIIVTMLFFNMLTSSIIFPFVIEFYAAYFKIYSQF